MNEQPVAVERQSARLLDFRPMVPAKLFPRIVEAVRNTRAGSAHDDFKRVSDWYLIHFVS